MLIANPIYDTVFKYLLEDLEVAKRLISNIIGEEIISLSVQPQEQTTQSARLLLTAYRIDFKAIILNIDGTTKKVLIELQKGKKAFDIMRFRHYLGDNYSKSDEVDGEKLALPIITIYFLGFKISIPKSVIKIGRVYMDVASGKEIKEKDDFIEKLTHDSFVIQIPHLPTKTQNKLEQILSVFSQKWIVNKDSNWIMEYPKNVENVKEDDLKLMLIRLNKIMQSEDMQAKIRLEEELERVFDNQLREKEMLLAEKEKALEEERKKTEDANRKAEDATKKVEEERKKNELQAQQILDLQKKLDELNR